MPLLGARRALPLAGQGKRARFSDSVVTAVDPGDGGASNQHKSQQSKTGINDPAIRLLRWLRIAAGFLVERPWGLVLSLLGEMA